MGKEKTRIIAVQLSILIFWVVPSKALLCYNCSSNHQNWDRCGGEFARPSLVFNSSRYYLRNCTGDNAMCFVRSWTARGKHAWIVQRGCYLPSKEDSLPNTVNIPTRAMTCKYERLADAEYKLCFCQADWCNKGSVFKTKLEQFLALMFFILLIGM